MSDKFRCCHCELCLPRITVVTFNTFERLQRTAPRHHLPHTETRPETVSAGGGGGGGVGVCVCVVGVLRPPFLLGALAET